MAKAPPPPQEAQEQFERGLTGVMRYIEDARKLEDTMQAEQMQETEQTVLPPAVLDDRSLVLQIVDKLLDQPVGMLVLFALLAGAFGMLLFVLWIRRKQS